MKNAYELMPYSLKTLPEIYDALRVIPGPVALFDFFSGELGHECIYGLACALKFWRDHRANKNVVALAWKGCDVLYQGVADCVIEFDSADVSTLDSAKHRGEGRYRWLLEQGHIEAVESIANVTAKFGPAFWQDGKRNSLQGRIPTQNFLEPDGYKTDWHGATRMLAKWLKASRFRFNVGPPLIKGKYLSFFGRDDPVKPIKNATPWQLEFVKALADEFGLGLVILGGMERRKKVPEGAKYFWSPHRDLATAINVMTNSVLHFSAMSGMTELAMVAGCNVVPLGHYKQHPLAAERFLAPRGFRWFGVLDAHDRPCVGEIRKFLAGKA